jgi:hypothetical protein
MIRLLKAFFSAMLLFNAIPHLVQGICGESHMTPFAIISAPAVNVIWAWVNLLIGGWLLKSSQPKEWTPRFWLTFCMGGFIISLSLAIFWSNPHARLPWQ